MVSRSRLRLAARGSIPARSSPPGLLRRRAVCYVTHASLRRGTPSRASRSSNAVPVAYLALGLEIYRVRPVVRYWIVIGTVNTLPDSSVRCAVQVPAPIGRTA